MLEDLLVTKQMTQSRIHVVSENNTYICSNKSAEKSMTDRRRIFLIITDIIPIVYCLRRRDIFIMQILVLNNKSSLLTSHFQSSDTCIFSLAREMKILPRIVAHVFLN